MVPRANSVFSVVNPMTLLRRLAAIVLAVVFAASLGAELIARSSYETQFREMPNAPASKRFLLGTDDLGRDRFARLLYGTRISLLLAPAAALLSTLLAGIIGGFSGYLGGWWDRSTQRVTDLFLSLPWIFLLLIARAMLPLNVSPAASVLVTFTLLGLLGWPAAARVVRGGARSMADSDYILQARAAGCPTLRLLWRHVLPNLKPVLLAQFWISVPVYILSEANLGLLGLGVAEPLPSWGGLLRELENYDLVLRQPWMLTPVLLLVIVVSCFQMMLSIEDLRS